MSVQGRHGFKKGYSQHVRSHFLAFGFPTDWNYSLVPIAVFRSFIRELTGALNMSLSQYAATPATSLPALALRSLISSTVTLSFGFWTGNGSASGCLAAVPRTS